MARRRKAEEALPLNFVSRPTSVSSKGQTTISAEIRREVGIEPGDQVVFSIASGRVVLDKSAAERRGLERRPIGLVNEWNGPKQDVYND